MTPEQIKNNLKFVKEQLRVLSDSITNDILRQNIDYTLLKLNLTEAQDNLQEALDLIEPRIKGLS